MSKRLENLIESVAPAWAAARAANRLRVHFSEQKAEAIAQLVAMAAHDSAERSRNTGDWNVRLLSSDQAVISDQPTSIARSRDAVRNNWDAVSIVDGHVRHQVGIGVTPRSDARHPRTGASLIEFNERADRCWYEWAEDKTLCHTERHWDFTGLESLTVREETTAGVSFAIFNYTPRVNDVGVHIQIVEFEQLVAWLVKNPDTGFWIRNGVEIDDYGAPVALWVFTKGHPLEYIQGRMAYTRIPWDRVMCSMRPERVRQSQGMGRLSPILQPMHHNKMYELYSVLRAQIECIAGASIETDMESLPPGAGGALVGGKPGTGAGGGQSPYADEKSLRLEPGFMVPLAPGRKFNFHAPTTPGSQYEPFTRMQTTKEAAGAGLDYPTVARDFSGMTYSGQLQGRLETWAETDPAQLRLVLNFCRPSREKVITMAILEGRLEAPGFDNPEWRKAYMKAEWRGPEKASINPSDDAAANKLNVDYRFETRRSILNKKNLGVREVFAQVSDEQRMAGEQNPPVFLPDAQPETLAVSPHESRPGAQDSRKEPEKNLNLAANVGELLDRIDHLTRENVALAERAKAVTQPNGQPVADAAAEAQRQRDRFAEISADGASIGKITARGHAAAVRAIDGSAVRADVDTDFTEGGHHLRYPYMAGEILYVEKSADLADQIANALHEAVEHAAMHDDPKLSYETAHAQALQAEQAYRKIGTVPDGVKIEIGGNS